MAIMYVFVETNQAIIMDSERVVLAADDGASGEFAAPVPGREYWKLLLGKYHEIDADEEPYDDAIERCVALCTAVKQT